MQCIESIEVVDSKMRLIGKKNLNGDLAVQKQYKIRRGYSPRNAP